MVDPVVPQFDLLFPIGLQGRETRQLQRGYHGILDIYSVFSRPFGRLPGAVQLTAFCVGPSDPGLSVRPAMLLDPLGSFKKKRRKGPGRS